MIVRGGCPEQALRVATAERKVQAQVGARRRPAQILADTTAQVQQIGCHGVHVNATESRWALGLGLWARTKAEGLETNDERLQAYNHSVRLPDRSAPTPPLPWRRLVRTAVVGACCALIVLALGRLTEWAVLGTDDAAARARTQAEVRASFDTMSRALRLMALGMADSETVVAATEGDVTAASRLFAAADTAITQGSAADFAVTAYGSNGQPLAWDGRPSDLPGDRLQGEEAWFFAQGALGLRLVYVTPVVTADDRRVGTIAAERSLGLSATPQPDVSTDAFRYASRLAPISIELGFEAGRTTPDPSAFEVPDPSGAHLFTASVDAADLARTRDRWRRASESLALATLAVALALFCVPLLDWRNRVPRARPYLAAVALVAGAIVASRLVFRLAPPTAWSQHPLLSGADYASPLLDPLLTSPFDFLMTAFAAGGLVALLLYRGRGLAPQPLASPVSRQGLPPHCRLCGASTWSRHWPGRTPVGA